MFKKSLLAFSILSFVGTAAAHDITNPFYLAMDGQVGSITTGSVSRTVSKNRTNYTKHNDIVALEELQYGLTDNLALIGTFGNTWDYWKANWAESHKTHHDDENVQWSAGMGWNILTGPARLQVSGKYGQDRLRNFSGEYKYIAPEMKLGYQFKTFLPYVSGGIEIPVAQKRWGNKLSYNTKAGIYQGKCEVWALDTGVRLNYDENTEARTFVAEAEASYYLTPKATIGVFGTYTFGGKAEKKTDIYSKSAGARVRMFF